MKSFWKLFAAVIAFLTLGVMLTDCYLVFGSKAGGARPYRVEINRAYEAMKSSDKIPDLSEYPHITKIERQPEFLTGDFFSSKSDYIIKEINGILYRFEYVRDNNTAESLLLPINLIMLFISGFVIFVLLYVRSRILSPFEKLAELPFELAKGNLSIPVKESKNRFFGKFLWGMDLLRENIEKQKSSELELQKEKKTLLLSLSHDIKTPLSAIKLYSKALSKGLYPDAEKRLEIALAIEQKADDIEARTAEIITAAREDFLSFEVNNTEFYLSALLKNIESYYSEKLKLISMELNISPYPNCLLKGDPDRAEEVIQNLMENAIKYGDGKTVEINVAKEDECILISVSNGGAKLSEEELPHIFESFWRGKNSVNVSGSGLGLYICRQLMREMKGEIFAESEGEELKVTAVFGKA